MRLDISLNQKDVSRAIGELKKYRDSLQTKNEIFVNRLLDLGIKVAEKHTGKYTGYISFEKEVSGKGRYVVGILKGIDTKPFISWWYYKGGKKVVEVSGLLMSEFGSGWLSEVLFDVPGVGQGTFPGQTHATDKQWYWTDDKGIHVSRGEVPTHPMYSAEMQMINQIYSIAREVFGSGI